MIYLVTGEQGRYSAHTLWFVRAFTQRVDAEALAGRLNAWCAERGLTRETFSWDDPKYAAWASAGDCPLEDPQFAHDLDGVGYSVVDVQHEAASIT